MTALIPRKTTLLKNLADGVQSVLSDPREKELAEKAEQKFRDTKISLFHDTCSAHANTIPKQNWETYLDKWLETIEDLPEEEKKKLRLWGLTSGKHKMTC